MTVAISNHNYFKQTFLFSELSESENFQISPETFQSVQSRSKFTQVLVSQPKLSLCGSLDPRSAYYPNSPDSRTVKAIIPRMQTPVHPDVGNDDNCTRCILEDKADVIITESKGDGGGGGQDSGTVPHLCTFNFDHNFLVINHTDCLLFSCRYHFQYQFRFPHEFIIITVDGALSGRDQLPDFN